MQFVIITIITTITIAMMIMIMIMMIRMQRGSRRNEDQDATRTKVQRGQRCNEDKYAMRIKLQRGNSVHPFTPFSVVLRYCGPNSSPCVLVLKGASPLFGASSEIGVGALRKYVAGNLASFLILWSYVGGISLLRQHSFIIGGQCQGFCRA